MVKTSETKEYNFELLWTEEGTDSLWEAWHFLAEKSEDNADSMAERAFERVEILSKHPYLGARVPELLKEKLPYRQLVLSKWPYRIIYRVDEQEEKVFILCLHPTKIPLEMFFDR